jgi:hypothetical protein
VPVTVAVSVTLPPEEMLVEELVTAVVVARPAVVIVKATAAELLALKLGSPLYCATIECDPAPKVEIPFAVNASPATFTPTLVAPATGVPLSTKVTVPVGRRLPVGLTVACRNSVTGAGPDVNGTKFVPEATSTLATVLLPALLTVTFTGAETLGANVPSPP